MQGIIDYSPEARKRFFRLAVSGRRVPVLNKTQLTKRTGPIKLLVI